MTISNEGDLEAAINALSERVRREIVLVDAQIAKSRAARGYVPTEGTPSKPNNGISSTLASPSAGKPTSPASVTQSVATAVALVVDQQTTTASAASSSSLDAQQKGGPLLNFGRTRMLQSFKPCYFVVDANKGFQWWDSAEAFRRNPTTPADSIPFFEVTSNSRASKFKKAVTCWPLILTEDCSKATDIAISYFALEYVNPKASSSGKTELLVLGASSETEKNEWVTHITKYVKLFLANRMESEAFLEFPVGSKNPTHISVVLDGEAPR
ncbi:Hypothetical protein, putative [Bodo saltans]|uniref:PH domain-containing protein n=1 Tax=Bodo saltans TaxID=75058 RepID=A0A0S4IRN5_BODSA|nr:Hypothetical protein, putative [Bodo saltans]|eukprot:CUG03099.1 Hypothetical protein, putative [Bodo saltans]